jgi:ABC-type Fe3+-siderophore transport system permease subunit
LIGVAGAILLIVAAVSLWQQHSIRRDALRATGRVVNLIPRRNAAGSVRYAPVIRYTDAQGIHRDFTASRGFGRGSYNVGDTVDVIYAPLNPESADIDAWQLRWGRVILFAAGGVALLALGSILRGRSRQA